MSATEDPDAATLVAQCGCTNLRKASRAVTQLYDEALAPVGIRATQLCVLLAAAAADGATVSVLAETLVMDRTTLSRNVQPLIRANLLSMTQVEEDRRIRKVVVTEEGFQRIRDAAPLWRRTQECLVARVGEARWNGMLADLERIVSVVREDSDTVAAE